MRLLYILLITALMALPAYAKDFAIVNNSIQLLNVSGALGNVLLVPVSGSVGIGTAAPTQLLQVQGATGIALVNDTDAGGQLIVNAHSATSNQSSLNFTNRMNNIWSIGTDNAGAGDNGLFITSRVGGDNTRLYINQSGNVGIGTTGPSTKFHVDGGGVEIDTSGGETSSLGRHLNLVSGLTPSDWRPYGGSTTAALQIQTASDRGLLLTPQTSGNTRFITTNGLDIYTNAAISPSSIGTYVMTLTSGNVGIGATSPSQRLDLGSGSIRIGGGALGSGGNCILSAYSAASCPSGWFTIGATGGRALCGQCS